jgi:hypothetical protein
MVDNVDVQLRKRLEDLGKRIDAKLQNLAEGGVLHGAEREAAADWRLQHLRLDEASKNGGKPRGELQTDIEALELTFDRWLARVDKRSKL